MTSKDPKELDPLKEFDETIGAMDKRIAGMKDRGYLPKYLEKLKDRRGELVYALNQGDKEKAAEIIDLAIEFGKEINKMKDVKPAPLGFVKSLIPKRRKKIEAAPKKEVVEAKKVVAENTKVYDSELNMLTVELAKREVELEGLKGAYANLSAEMGEMRRKMEEKEAKDVKALSAQIVELKKGLDGMHGTMATEFKNGKAAYTDFGSELLSLAIKVSELEDLIESGDLVTEVDVIELNHAVGSLEKKLVLVEARQKTERLALLDKVQNDQKKMMKQLAGKADTQKMVSAMKQYVSEIKHDVAEQETRLAAEMQVELKSSYYTLDQKLKKLEKALGKARTKKDLVSVQAKVEELGKHVEKVRGEEMRLKREMDQQHLSDDAILQRINSVSERVRKSGEMDSLAIADVYKTIDALEAQVSMSDAESKKAKAMARSISAIKKDLSVIEGEAEDVSPKGKRKPSSAKPKTRAKAVKKKAKAKKRL
ncbi:hypothetical protein ACFLQ2_01385 [archaeon]